MDAFVVHTGVGVPLRRSNVETDQIIPAVFLKRVTRHGYEDGLFASWRINSNFVLNQENYHNGTVLVAGSHFGIGSSREHAVWALQDYGFKVVLASSFADIFRANAGVSGLLAAQVSYETAERLCSLLEHNPGCEITVNLVSMRVHAENIDEPFEVDEHVRIQLLEGKDNIDATLSHSDDITKFESNRSDFMPITYPK